MAAVSGGVTRYLDHLPAVLQQGPFIGPFLTAFERILSGPPPGTTPPPGVTPPEGIEQILDRIDTFFDPDLAPEDFIPWLAGWVALALRDDWDLATRRAFIGKVVPLYKKRGTRAGLRELLDTQAAAVSVVDHDDDLIPPRFNAASPEHYFEVIVRVSGNDALAMARTVRQIISIVDREKPAHSYYGLDIEFPPMQINDDRDLYPEYGPGIQVGMTALSADHHVELKYAAMQINDDPDAFPSFGAGILTGVNTILGTEP
ncbi:NHL repeat domain protein [Minicystis rosea]|nr:NHL repeat domain protein [Minicystis rosea]